MTLVRAVLRYRSKFIDCAAGAVPNNRHDLDLLDGIVVGMLVSFLHAKETLTLGSFFELDLLKK
jgi:hypothetical protein